MFCQDQFSDLTGNTTHRFFIPIIINSSCHVLYIEKINLQSEYSRPVYNFIIQFGKWIEELTKTNPQSHETVQLNILESTRKYYPEATIVYSSTNKVYGDLEYLEYDETETRYIPKKYPN